MIILSITLILLGTVCFLKITIPQKINKAQRKILKHYGIIHFTDEANKDFILADRTIKSNCNGKTYFFTNNIIRKESLITNHLQGKGCVIVITNLNSMQISKFRIRINDLALEYSGDFCIEDRNIVQYFHSSDFSLKFSHITQTTVFIFLVLSIILTSAGLIMFTQSFLQ